MASFKWVNTTLGNIKCAITGTYRKLGPDHTGRYLGFAWRYNRRYQLQTMIPRFVHSAVTNRTDALSPPHRRMNVRDKQRPSLAWIRRSECSNCTGWIRRRARSWI